MGHAAFFVMRHGAAKLLLGHFLVRNGLDDVWPGDEHIGRVAGHENEIGNRRRINRATSARSHDGADLRNHATGKRVAEKNIGVTRERGDAFLNASAAGVVEADDGSTRTHGQIHDLADFARVGFRERAAKNSKVLRKHVNEASIDVPKPRDEAIAGRALLLHPKIDAAVPDKLVQLFKRAFVEQ